MRVLFIKSIHYLSVLPNCSVALKKHVGLGIMLCSSFCIWYSTLFYRMFVTEMLILIAIRMSRDSCLRIQCEHVLYLRRCWITRALELESTYLDDGQGYYIGIFHAVCFNLYSLPNILSEIKFCVTHCICVLLINGWVVGVSKKFYRWMLVLRTISNVWKSFILNCLLGLLLLSNVTLVVANDELQFRTRLLTV